MNFRKKIISFTLLVAMAMAPVFAVGQPVIDIEAIMSDINQHVQQVQQWNRQIQQWKQDYDKAMKLAEAMKEGDWRTITENSLAIATQALSFNSYSSNFMEVVNSIADYGLDQYDRYMSLYEKISSKYEKLNATWRTEDGAFNKDTNVWGNQNLAKVNGVLDYGFSSLDTMADIIDNVFGTANDTAASMKRIATASASLGNYQEKVDKINTDMDTALQELNDLNNQYQTAVKNNGAEGNEAAGILQSIKLKEKEIEDLDASLKSMDNILINANNANMKAVAEAANQNKAAYNSLARSMITSSVDIFGDQYRSKLSVIAESSGVGEAMAYATERRQALNNKGNNKGSNATQSAM